MSEVVTKEFLVFVTFVFPGFLTAWVFYSLTSHTKPSQFERTIQALIFTFIVQALILLIRWIAESVGQYYSIGKWGELGETFSAILVAVTLGIVLAFFTNNDKFHSFLRSFGFTSRTSHPSEWFYVFSTKVTFIILHFKDGRRLYGWPKEWPIEPGKGQFYLMLPSWILEDGKQLDLPELDGILVAASDIQWVEFVKTSEN